MNDYGYLIYEDYPRDVNTTVSVDFDMQSNARLPVVLTDEDYKADKVIDWATFEENEFNFRKQLWKNETQNICCVSRTISNDAGDFIGQSSIELEFDKAISGSGFTLYTLMEDYRITITLFNSNGVVAEEAFHKTEDEFYHIVFDDITRVKIKFTLALPNHFIKVYGVRIGRIQKLVETDMVTEPQITNNFSLSGEELPYDILEFSIYGIKETFNFINGEKISYIDVNKNEQVFYVNNAIYNSNGTIDVTCYDEITRQEKEFTGLLGTKYDVRDTFSNLTFSKDINLDFSDIENEKGNTYSGTIPPITIRETNRMLLQGTNLRLIKKGNTYKLIRKTEKQPIFNFFNESNIVSVPVIEQFDEYGEFRFNKHYYSVNKKDGSKEAFNGVVNTSKNKEDLQTLQTQYPFINRAYFYVSGIDSEGKDILVNVDFDKKFKVISTGAYTERVWNTYTQRIVTYGYAFSESVYQLRLIDPVISKRFSYETLAITNCTVCSNYDQQGDYITEFMPDLRNFYSYNKKVSFSSVYNANCGDKTTINFDGNNLVGFITKKIDRMNGVYEYEVMCK